MRQISTNANKEQTNSTQKVYLKNESCCRLFVCLRANLKLLIPNIAIDFENHCWLLSCKSQFFGVYCCCYCCCIAFHLKWLCCLSYFWHVFLCVCFFLQRKANIFLVNFFCSRKTHLPSLAGITFFSSFFAPSPYAASPFDLALSLSLQDTFQLALSISQFTHMVLILA